MTATTGWRETHTGKWHYYPGGDRRLVAVCVSDNGGVGPYEPDDQHVASDKDCKSCRRYVDRSVK